MEGTMRVRVREVGPGLHPSEIVVQIETVEGPERLVVDRRSVHADSSIDVGYPVGRNNGYYLIELPRETIHGSWRVWIASEVIADEALEGVA
jgi:hypothetical protein